MKIPAENEIISLLKKSDNIVIAYGFGSRITDKIRYGSDLDIALYFNNEPDLLELGGLVNELEKVTELEIDIVSLNNQYRTNPKLAYSIIDTGVLLYCNNPELLREVKRKIFLGYLDFMPICSLFEKKLHERLLNRKFAVRE